MSQDGASTPPPSAPLLIGWSEYIDLPRWKIRGIRAKVDTGARTSALHVDRIEPLGGERIRFDVVLHRKKTDRRVTVVARIKRRCAVRSSTGATEMRYVVTTVLVLGRVRKSIEVTLASRGDMIFRMLLGRNALAHDFTIDVGRRYVATSKPKKRKRRSRTALQEQLATR
jgi:hypothetical protein